MKKIFEGIRVLDFGRYVSCNYCGSLLADLGAEVIKIEKVGGEDCREIGPFVNGESLYVPTYSRNKKCITVNFRSEKGKEILKELVKKADVIIENFRPGTIQKMGLGYEDVKRINPKIIMASISGFGQAGPYMDRAAFDLIINGVSGLLSLGGTEETPIPPGYAALDHLSGTFAAFGVASALFQREITGEGNYIDVAMLDCALPLLEFRLPNYAATGQIAGPRGNMKNSQIEVPSGIYKTKDGYVILAAGADNLFNRFKTLVDDEVFHLLENQKLEGRVKNVKEIDRVTAAWCAQYTSVECERLLREVGIPTGIVADMKNVYEDNEQIKYRGSIVQIDVPGMGKLPFAANPVHFAHSGADQYIGVPKPGHDNQQVLSELLNMTSEEIDRLQTDGII